MHKGVILLTKAENRKEAYSKVEDFLEEYEGNVWDCYALGNRWNNTLAPKEKLDQFTEWVQTECKEAFHGLGHNVSKMEEPENRKKVQDKWESMGLIGKNPYYSGHGLEIDSDANTEDYNIVPLGQCIDTVKKWCRDVEKEAEEHWSDALEAKAERNAYGVQYNAQSYSDLINGNFSFDSNVYNVDTLEAEKTPDDIEEYWAVMIDMHN